MGVGENFSFFRLFAIASFLCFCATKNELKAKSFVRPKFLVDELAKKRVSSELF